MATFNPAMPRQGRATTSSVRDNFIALKALIDSGGGGGMGYYDVTETEYYDGLSAGTLAPGLYEFLYKGLKDEPIEPAPPIPVSTAGTAYVPGSLDDGTHILLAGLVDGIAVLDSATGELVDTIRFPTPQDSSRYFTYVGMNRTEVAFGKDDGWAYFSANGVNGQSNPMAYNERGQIFCYNYTTGEKRALNAAGATPTNDPGYGMLLRAGTPGQWTNLEGLPDASWLGNLQPATGGTFAIPYGSQGYICYLENGAVVGHTASQIYNYNSNAFFTHGEKLYGFAGGGPGGGNLSRHLTIVDKTLAVTQSADLPNNLSVYNSSNYSGNCGTGIVQIGDIICILAVTTTTTSQPYSVTALTYNVTSNTWTEYAVNSGITDLYGVFGAMPIVGFESGGKAYFQLGSWSAPHGTTIVEIDPTDGSVQTHLAPITSTVQNYGTYYRAMFRALSSGKFFGSLPVATFSQRPYLFDPVSKAFTAAPDTLGYSSSTTPLVTAEDDGCVWVAVYTQYTEPSGPVEIKLSDLSTGRNFVSREPGMFRSGGAAAVRKFPNIVVLRIGSYMYSLGQEIKPITQRDTGNIYVSNCAPLLGPEKEYLITKNQSGQWLRWHETDLTALHIASKGNQLI